ncbi:MAG: oligosaccharide flippase family protein, partial [Gammaproteobacteria bacterium]|nr:oligosaccharide flippase family protein [Gammaproteobacteria bacterium]
FEYDDIDEKNSVVSTNLIGSFVISIVGIMSIYMIAPGLVDALFDDDVSLTGLYLILAILLFELSSQVCLAYIRAIEYSILFVSISLIKLIIQVVVNIYLVMYLEMGVIGVLSGNLITVFLGWLVLVVFTIKRCGLDFSLGKFKLILIYCYPLLLTTIVKLVSNNADKFVLNELISLHALGIYALALKFSMLIEQLIGEPFSRSYGAFRYTIMKKSNASQIQSNIVRYLLIISVLISLITAMFIDEVLRVMSDSEFWPAAEIVPLLMIVSILRIMIYPAQTGILYAKKTKYFFIFSIYSAIVNLVASIILIYYIGIIGACLSLILTESLVLYLTHKRSQELFYVRYDFKPLLYVVILGILLYLPVLLISDYDALARLFVKMLLLMLFVTIIITQRIITDEELGQLRFYFVKIFKPKAV